MLTALRDGNFDLVPVEKYLPLPNGGTIAVWKGLEIHRVTIASGGATRNGGRFRRLSKYPRGDDYSRGYWVLPYWGPLVPIDRYSGKKNRSETAYWTEEYPIGTVKVRFSNEKKYTVEQYGCIDGRPSLLARPYLGNLGPLLDEAVDEAPIFYVVTLDDDMMEQVDAKASVTLDLDSSSCPVGNRYILCSRKGTVNPKRYWTTLYGRPYDDTKAVAVATDEMCEAKRKPDNRRRSNIWPAL